MTHINHHSHDHNVGDLTIDGIYYQAVKFDSSGWMVTKFLTHPVRCKVEQLVSPTTLTRPDDVIRHAIQVNSWD